MVTLMASARSIVPVRTEERAASKSPIAGPGFDPKIFVTVDPGVVISKPMSSGLGAYFTMSLLGRVVLGFGGYGFWCMGMRAWGCPLVMDDGK